MKELKGRTAVVTGGARRLGRHIALTLAAKGMNVVIHYATSRREAEEAASLAAGKGVQAWTVQADFSDPGGTASFARNCEEISTDISVLINSASIFRHGSVLEAPAHEFIENFEINALAPLALSRWFSRRCPGGSIVNLLDARMDDYVKDHIPYALSKQALKAITRILSLELAPRIRVNAVAPGVVLPPPGEGEEYLRKWSRTNPLEAWGSPEDISDAVLYLLQASFVTGQVIYVDGGRHLKETAYDR